jgi:hypothetical protein
MVETRASSWKCTPPTPSFRKQILLCYVSGKPPRSAFPESSHGAGGWATTHGVARVKHIPDISGILLLVYLLLSTSRSNDVLSKERKKKNLYPPRPPCQSPTSKQTSVRELAAFQICLAHSLLKYPQS